MRELRIELRMNQKEKKEINKISKTLGLSVSEYIRRKLFEENEDLAATEDKFISPHVDKHNVLNVTMIYRIFYLVREILKNQKDIGAIAELERTALDFARKEREKYGYKRIEAKDE
jgi:3-methyladenine DNA glycosylase AlkC